MSDLKYNVFSHEGEAISVTVFTWDGRSLVATKDHPAFTKIVEALTNKTGSDQDILDMIQPAAKLARKFAPLSERVSVAFGSLYFDGDKVDGVLAETIVRFEAEQSDNLAPLVAFMEKLYTNPNPHSIEHLYRWLRLNSFGICPDGDFIAYKGIKHDGLSDHAGRAFVNGELIEGRIPNAEGTIIEMPRSEVTFDPNVGCHTGLHAGNWDYARSFAPVTVRVKINPRDVVSVPVDASDQKLRVCRYKVLGRVEKPDTELFYPHQEIKTAIDGALVVKFEPKPEPEEDSVQVVEGGDYPVADEKPATSSRTKSKKETTKETAKKPVAKKETTKKPATKKETTTKTTGRTGPVGKAAPAKATKPAKPAPKYFEELTKAQFAELPFNKLRWLVSEWEVPVKGSNPNKLTLVDALVKAARVRSNQAKANPRKFKRSKLS